MRTRHQVPQTQTVQWRIKAGSHSVRNFSNTQYSVDLFKGVCCSIQNYPAEYRHRSFLATHTNTIIN